MVEHKPQESDVKKLFKLFALATLLCSTIASAYTLTPNYNFYLPGVNNPSDANNWGTYLNDNFSSIDTLMPGLDKNNVFTGTNTFNESIKFATGKGVLDANGNEELLFTTTTSAVTYLNLTNGATGNGPILSCLGESNTDCNFQATGTGDYNFKGTSTDSASIKLFEDTDNGTNYVGFKSPSSLAGNAEYQLPSADGTANQVLATNGSKTLSFIDVLRVTASSIGASGYFTLNNGIIIQYGISGSLPAAGTVSTVNLPTSFTGTEYAVVAVPSFTSTGGQANVGIPARTASSFDVQNSTNVAGAFYYIAIGH